MNNPPILDAEVEPPVTTAAKPATIGDILANDPTGPDGRPFSDFVCPESVCPHYGAIRPKRQV